MDIEPLLSLGLTKTEAKIYIDLLELGPSLVGTLSKKTGFHRRSLYDALERLINKGLVSYITTNNRKYFEAADPSTLLELQKEQEHRIKDLLPELNLKKQMSKDDNDTTFFRGVQGLKSVFNDQLKERKEILVFGACHGPDKVEILVFGGCHGLDKVEILVFGGVADRIR